MLNCFFFFFFVLQNWHRDSPIEYFRLSLNFYSSVPLVSYIPILHTASWGTSLVPTLDTAARLNLTFLSFLEEPNNTFKYVVWTVTAPGVENGTETVHAVKTFHHLFDADVESGFYYDPDMRAFFEGVNDISGGGGNNGGGSDDVLLIVLVSVLIPIAVIGGVGVGGAIGVLFMKDKLRMWRARKKLESNAVVI